MACGLSDKRNNSSPPQRLQPAPSAAASWPG
jgi:hypothetical protein